MKKEAVQHQTTITQANSFIEGVYDLRKLELNIFLTLLAKHKKGEDVFKNPIHLSQTDLSMKHMDKGNFSRDLRRFTDRISDIKFRYETATTYEPLHTFSPVLRKDSHTIQIKLSLEIRDLVNIWTSNFTEADVDTLLRIPTFTTYRIYMMLKQYQGFRTKRRFTLAKLREMLCLQDQKSYELYGSFKQRILDPAKEHLRGTDMAFEFTPIKRGKQFIGVTFELSNKPEYQAKPKTPPPAGNWPQLQVKKEEDVVRFNAITIMRNYGIPDNQIVYFLDKLPPLTITQTNKWFKTNRASLSFPGTDGEYFSTLLNNKIKK